MYNENSSFSIKNVIIQFLFIALFIFILIWLFPLKSDIANLNKDCDNSAYSVLIDRIFNENIIAMKDAAKSYYTTSRLPKNVGDKTKMTLGEMLDKKIILPFTDKNGDTCSLTESYVEITKYDEEYIMKVNLKCGEEENYLLVYMGCYDYCSTTICEKNTSDIKTPVIYSPTKNQPEETKPTTNNVINNIINNVIKNEVSNKNENPNKNEDPKEEPKVEEKYYCQIVNNKYYDKNGNIVSAEAYKESCEPKVVEYLYEYSKTTKGYCTESDWSEWATDKIEPSSTVSVQTKTVTTNKLIGYNVTTALDYSKPIYGTKEVATGAYETKDVCASYGYVNTGEYSYGEWTYTGDVYLTYSPSDTDTVKYVRVSDSDWVCKENCAVGTTYKFKKYERKATAITKYQCTNWETQSVPITTTVQYITGYERVVVNKEPVYKKVDTIYYRSKTKTCYPDVKDTKWSSYNDTTLLNAGYSYTGNKKQK